MNQPVEIYIDELILHGFSPHDRYHIANAVETELSRMFSEQGVPSSFSNGGVIPLLNAGSFQMTHPARSYTTGVQVANAVYSSFTDAGSELR
jgi:hypothetical protein